jgi:hypothetical protein
VYLLLDLSGLAGRRRVQQEKQIGAPDLLLQNGCPVLLWRDIAGRDRKLDAVTLNVCE